MRLIPFSLKQLTPKLEARHTSEIVWVLVSQVASLIGGLLLLKLLTNLLPAATFGYVSLITIAIIFPTWLLFLPFSQALIRFYFAHKESNNLRHLIGTTLRGYLSSSFFVIALGFVAALLGLQDRAGISILDLGLSVALLVIEAWRGLALGILAADRKRMALARQSLFDAGLRPILVYAFISAFGPWVYSVLTAYICSSLLLLILVQSSVKEIIPKGGQFEYEGRLAREMLRYGFPMGIAAIFSWVQNYADRFVVALLLGVDVAGQYAAALQLSQFPFVAGASFLSVLISPVANQMAGDASSEEATAKGTRLIAAATVVFAGLGLLLVPLYYFFGDLLTKIVASKEYVMPASLIAMLAIGALLRSVGNLLGQGFLVKNRTDRFLAMFSLLGTVSPIISYVLISSYKLHGAGMALVVAGVMYALGTGLVIRIVQRRPLFDSARVNSPPLC
jgi:O-antigen/teichoic acid export membrane protein